MAHRPDQILRLLEKLVVSEGEARHKLAEANAEVLRSEMTQQIVKQRVDISAKRVKRLERALAAVRRAQEAAEPDDSEEGAWDTWKESAQTYADGLKTSADPVAKWVRSAGAEVAGRAGRAWDWVKGSGEE